MIVVCVVRKYLNGIYFQSVAAVEAIGEGKSKSCVNLNVKPKINLNIRAPFFYTFVAKLITVDVSASISTPRKNALF